MLHITGRLTVVTVTPTLPLTMRAGLAGCQSIRVGPQTLLPPRRVQNHGPSNRDSEPRTNHPAPTAAGTPQDTSGNQPPPVANQPQQLSQPQLIFLSYRNQPLPCARRNQRGQASWIARTQLQLTRNNPFRGSHQVHFHDTPTYRLWDPGSIGAIKETCPNTVRPNNYTRASGVADREKGAGRDRLEAASLANAAEKTKGAGQSCSARKSYSGLPSWQLRQRNASQGAARLALERPAQREAPRVTDRS
jgi:hypothetical protein